MTGANLAQDIQHFLNCCGNLRGGMDSCGVVETGQQQGVYPFRVCIASDQAQNLVLDMRNQGIAHGRKVIEVTVVRHGQADPWKDKGMQILFVN